MKSYQQRLWIERLDKIASFVDEFEGFHIMVNTGNQAYFRETEGEAFEHISQYNNALAYIEKFEDLPEGEKPTNFCYLFNALT